MAVKTLKSIRNSIQRGFFRAALVSVVTIGGFAIFSHVLTVFLLAPVEHATARMESTTIQSVRVIELSRIAQMLATERRPGKLYQLRAELRTTLDAFEKAHKDLTVGNQTLGLSARMTTAMRDQLFNAETGLDRWVRDLISALRKGFLNESLRASADDAQLVDEMVRFQLNPSLMAVSAQMADDAWLSLRIASVVRVALLGLLFLMLAGLGALVFRPLSNRIIRVITAREGKDVQNINRYDEITGLPNRAYLREFLEDHIESNVSHNLRSAILHIDLKNYAKQKDQHGLAFSHGIMRMSARRIESICRSGDFVARIGGDEFVVVATAIEDHESVSGLAEAIRTKLSLPYAIDGNDLALGCNIGIAFLDKNDRNVDRILTHAELALEDARKSEHCDIQYYTPEMRTLVNQREKLRDALENALANGQVKAHFQPMIDASTGELIGLEALARWHHPNKGILTPVHFIEVAMHFGLGEAITRAILADVLKAMRSWDDANIVMPIVAINMALEQFSDSAKVEELKWAVDSYDILPSRIAFEIDEKIFQTDGDSAISTNLRHMVDNGFKLYLDDFGTGHIDRGMLRALNIARVKIDRAFVANIDSDGEQQSVTAELIAHAHECKIKTIAEGVETPAERLMLQRLGCDGIQGFLIAEPMSFDIASRWLTSHAFDVKAS